MTRYLTIHGCCPPLDIFQGGRRPQECEHGRYYYTEKELARKSVGVGAGDPGSVSGISRSGSASQSATGVDPSTPKPRRRSTLKRSEQKRDWSLAVAKKEEEGERCRVCGAYGVEAAHILGKKFDQPISPGSKTLLVLPDRIVPLCPDHHRAYDAHSLDLLGHLTAPEQAQAVLDAGSMGLALKRISPMLEMAA